MTMALVMIGAGCNSSSTATYEAPESEFDVQGWYVTFDDGQDWYAYARYFDGMHKFGEGVERSTGRGLNNALVQNTNKAIQLPNLGHFEDTEYTESDDWIMMDVTVYPEVATMPDDLELVEADGRLLGVRRGNAFDAWYYKSEDKLYEIIPRIHEDGDADIDAIMKTIKEQ